MTVCFLKSVEIWAVNTNIIREGVVGLQIIVRQCNDVTILDLTGKATIDASEGELLSKRLRALTNNGKHKLLLNLANLTVFAVFARAS